MGKTVFHQFSFVCVLSPAVMCLHLTVWTEVQNSSPDDKSMSSKLMLKNFFPIHVRVKLKKVRVVQKL